MRVPPSAAADIQQAIRTLNERVDRLGASAAPNQNLAGRRVINAGDAQADTDYVTLQQHRGATETAVNEARATLLRDFAAAAKVATAPAALTDLPGWLAGILARL